MQCNRPVEPSCVSQSTFTMAAALMARAAMEGRSIVLKNKRLVYLTISLIIFLLI